MLPKISITQLFTVSSRKQLGTMYDHDSEKNCENVKGRGHGHFQHVFFNIIRWC